MIEPSPANKCPNCGTVLPANAPEGLCPKCLLLGMAAPTDSGTGPVRPAPPDLQTVAAAFPQLEVLEYVGQGGMGCVFKARQPQLNRFVALKILPEALARDATFASRFTREAQALAALNHPNIVTVHDFGQSGGFFHLLMEFVDGVNLRQALRAGHFTPEQALAIVPPICDALQFAHERGIVHCDIKPENLLLDRNGRVKIADFGIAKMVNAAPLAADERVAGTPHYMAPEQKDNPQRTDHRADIYSLGVVFYEMLTGELPGAKLQPPSRKVQIDVRLDEVVLRALDKSPEMRWQTAAEMQTQVETIVASGTPTAGSPTATRKTFDRTSGSGSDVGTPLKHSARKNFVGALLLCLPSALFAWFALVGYRTAGIDLDADVQFWAGLIGFPFSAGLGALLAWLAGAFRETEEISARVQPRRWSARAIAATALLTVSVLLMGGGMVMIALVAQDPHWNPSPAEVIFVLIVVNGGLAAAATATLLGWMARRQIGREPQRWRGWGGAFAAARFWPGVIAGLLILSLPALTSGRSLREAAVRNAVATETAISGLTVDSSPPVVVETQPASGARDVAPGIAEIRVRFSKEITDGSWSWTMAWDDSTPEVIEAPGYDATRRTCVIKVKLSPGRTYAWWLNSERFQNFKDKDGNPALPYLLIFQTSGTEGSP